MTPTREEWRPVVGYEGLYEVSDRGRVRSLPRYKTRGCIRKLTPNHGHGYLELELWSGGVHKRYYVHRLVAEAFCPHAPDQPIVRHMDGDKTNNVPANLQWGTPSENNYDTVRHGLNWQAAKTHCGSGHEFTPENTIIKKARRSCRTCAYASNNRGRRERSLLAGTLRDPNRCKNGHPLDEANTYRHGAKRYCRACRRRASAAHVARKAA